MVMVVYNNVHKVVPIVCLSPAARNASALTSPLEPHRKQRIQRNKPAQDLISLVNKSLFKDTSIHICKYFMLICRIYRKKMDPEFNQLVKL